MYKIEELLNFNTTDSLEPIANSVKKSTKNIFTKEITMYTPVYLTNYCNNDCRYCAFSVKNKQMKRTRLTFSEIEAEFYYLKNKGFQHILLVGGEDFQYLSTPFLIKVIRLAKRLFIYVGLEIQPLSQEIYQLLKLNGLDGVTIYQETYDLIGYQNNHLSGPKSNFSKRLMRIEAAAKAGIKALNIGVLFGLGNYHTDIIGLNNHLQYLQKNYPNIELSVSLLRIKPINGQSATDYQIISDFMLVKALLIIRYLNPTVSITMSTRETIEFKQKLLQFGVKKVSACVSTAVGGHINPSNNVQFTISDNNDLSSEMNAIEAAGFIPVLQNWF